MASKRNLYRPAQVQENVGQRKPRKTLSQGRLISSHTGPQQLQTSAVSHSPSHGTSNTSGNASRLHTSLIQGQLEESIFSPRRLVPQASEPRSPRQGPPARSLDLSDSDDYMELPQEVKGYQPEVLCIDASRQTVDADASEVDIRIGVEKSPVRIICHSPARTTSHSSRTREEQENAVTIDTENRQYSPQVIKTKAVIREKLPDSINEPTTAVQSIPMSPSLGSRKILQTLPSNLPQPDFDNVSDTDVAAPKILVEIEDLEGDNNSVISDLVSEDREVLHVKKSKVANKTGNLTHAAKSKATLSRKVAPGSSRKEPLKRPDTDKKKKGKFVPSRYMQDAESKAKLSLFSKMEKTTLDKSGNVSNKSIKAPPVTKKTARKVVKPAELSASQRLNVDRPHTPENQSIASSVGAKTSTPTMDGTFLSHDMDIDASAIHPEVSLLAADTSKTGNGRSRSRLIGQSMISNASILQQSTVSTKPKPKKDLKTLQQKLGLAYIYNLQWAFVEAKARKTLEEREKQAMAQIYGMHEELEKLRKIKADKEQNLAKLRHVNRTDHLTEVQRQCLGPVINNLSTLKKQHQCLAEALDTTRHQIATKDVHLPENEDQFQGRLEAHLLESERLLGEISAVTRQDVPKVTDMANAIVTMETNVEEMETELKKSRELLAATETLTMHECSLRVQEIQLMS